MPEPQCLIITLPETVYIILIIILRLPHLEDIAFRHVSASALSWQQGVIILQDCKFYNTVIILQDCKFFI